MEAIYKMDSVSASSGESMISIFSMDKEDFRAWQILEYVMHTENYWWCVHIDAELGKKINKLPEWKMKNLPTDTILVTDNPEIINSIEDKIKTRFNFLEKPILGVVVEALQEAGVDVDPKKKYTVLEIIQKWKEFIN